jgi:hypothetical protein
MLSKLTSLGAMALIGSLGVAAAQTPTSAQPRAAAPRTAAEVSADTANGARQSGGKVPNYVAGWNYFHISYCQSFYYGSTYYLYFFPTTGGYWYTANPYFQALISPACGTGNWAAVYVYDSSGDWNYANVYSFQ